jgi:hypothetical protein
MDAVCAATEQFVCGAPGAVKTTVSTDQKPLLLVAPESSSQDGTRKAGRRAHKKAKLDPSMEGHKGGREMKKEAIEPAALPMVSKSISAAGTNQSKDKSDFHAEATLSSVQLPTDAHIEIDISNLKRKPKRTQAVNPWGHLLAAALFGKGNTPQHGNISDSSSLSSRLAKSGSDDVKHAVAADRDQLGIVCATTENVLCGKIEASDPSLPKIAENSAPESTGNTDRAICTRFTPLGSIKSTSSSRKPRPSPEYPKEHQSRATTPAVEVTKGRTVPSPIAKDNERDAEVSLKPSSSDLKQAEHPDKNECIAQPKRSFGRPPVPVRKQNQRPAQVWASKGSRPKPQPEIFFARTQKAQQLQQQIGQSDGDDARIRHDTEQVFQKTKPQEDQHKEDLQEIERKAEQQEVQRQAEPQEVQRRQEPQEVQPEAGLQEELFIDELQEAQRKEEPQGELRKTDPAEVQHKAEPQENYPMEAPSDEAHSYLSSEEEPSLGSASKEGKSSSSEGAQETRTNQIMEMPVPDQTQNIESSVSDNGQIADTPIPDDPQIIDLTNVISSAESSSRFMIDPVPQASSSSSVTKDDTAVFASIMRQSQKPRTGRDPDAPKCGLDGLGSMEIAFEPGKADSGSHITQSLSTGYQSGTTVSTASQQYSTAESTDSIVDGTEDGNESSGDEEYEEPTGDEEFEYESSLAESEPSNTNTNTNSNTNSVAASEKSHSRDSRSFCRDPSVEDDYAAHGQVRYEEDQQNPSVEDRHDPSVESFHQQEATTAHSTTFHEAKSHRLAPAQLAMPSSTDSSGVVSETPFNSLQKAHRVYGSSSSVPPIELSSHVSLGTSKNKQLMSDAPSGSSENKELLCDAPSETSENKPNQISNSLRMSASDPSREIEATTTLDSTGPYATISGQSLDEDMIRKEHSQNISASQSVSFHQDIYAYDFKKNSLLESKDTDFSLRKNSILASKSSILASKSEAMGSLVLDDIPEDDHIDSFQSNQAPFNATNGDSSSQSKNFEEEYGISVDDFKQPAEIIFCDESKTSGTDDIDAEAFLSGNGRHVQRAASCPEMVNSMDGASVEAIEYSSAPTDVFGDHFSLGSSQASKKSGSTKGPPLRPAPSTGEQKPIQNLSTRPVSPIDGIMAVVRDSAKAIGFTTDSSKEVERLNSKGADSRKVGQTQNRKAGSPTNVSASDFNMLSSLNSVSRDDDKRKDSLSPSTRTIFSESDFNMLSSLKSVSNDDGKRKETMSSTARTADASSLHCNESTEVSKKPCKSQPSEKINAHLSNDVSKSPVASEPEKKNPAHVKHEMPEKASNDNTSPLEFLSSTVENVVSSWVSGQSVDEEKEKAIVLNNYPEQKDTSGICVASKNGSVALEKEFSSKCNGPSPDAEESGGGPQSNEAAEEKKQDDPPQDNEGDVISNDNDSLQNRRSNTNKIEVALDEEVRDISANERLQKDKKVDLAGELCNESSGGSNVEVYEEMVHKLSLSQSTGESLSKFQSESANSDGYISEESNPEDNLRFFTRTEWNNLDSENEGTEVVYLKYDPSLPPAPTESESETGDDNEHELSYTMSDNYPEAQLSGNKSNEIVSGPDSEDHAAQRNSAEDIGTVGNCGTAGLLCVAPCSARRKNKPGMATVLQNEGGKVANIRSILPADQETNRSTPSDDEKSNATGCNSSHASLIDQADNRGSGSGGHKSSAMDGEVDGTGRKVPMPTLNRTASIERDNGESVCTSCSITNKSAPGEDSQGNSKDGRELGHPVPKGFCSNVSSSCLGSTPRKTHKVNIEISGIMEGQEFFKVLPARSEEEEKSTNKVEFRDVGVPTGQNQVNNTSMVLTREQELELLKEMRLKTVMTVVSDSSASQASSNPGVSHTNPENSSDNERKLQTMPTDVSCDLNMLSNMSSLPSMTEGQQLENEAKENNIQKTNDMLLPSPRPATNVAGKDPPPADSRPSNNDRYEADTYQSENTLYPNENSSMSRATFSKEESDTDNRTETFSKEDMEARNEHSSFSRSTYSKDETDMGNSVENESLTLSPAISTSEPPNVHEGQKLVTPKHDETDEEFLASPPKRMKSLVSCSDVSSFGFHGKLEPVSQDSMADEARLEDPILSEESTDDDSKPSRHTHTPSFVSGGYVSENCGSTLRTRRDDPFLSQNTPSFVNLNLALNETPHQDSTEETELSAPPLEMSSNGAGGSNRIAETTVATTNSVSHKSQGRSPSRHSLASVDVNHSFATGSSMKGTNTPIQSSTESHKSQSWSPSPADSRNLRRYASNDSFNDGNRRLGPSPSAGIKGIAFNGGYEWSASGSIDDQTSKMHAVSAGSRSLASSPGQKPVGASSLRDSNIDDHASSNMQGNQLQGPSPSAETMSLVPNNGIESFNSIAHDGRGSVEMRNSFAADDNTASGMEGTRIQGSSLSAASLASHTGKGSSLRNLFADDSSSLDKNAQGPSPSVGPWSLASASTAGNESFIDGSIANGQSAVGMQNSFAPTASPSEYGSVAEEGTRNLPSHDRSFINSGVVGSSHGRASAELKDLARQGPLPSGGMKSVSSRPDIESFSFASTGNSQHTSSEMRSSSTRSPMPSVSGRNRSLPSHAGDGSFMSSNVRGPPADGWSSAEVQEVDRLSPSQSAGMRSVPPIEVSSSSGHFSASTKATSLATAAVNTSLNDSMRLPSLSGNGSASPEARKLTSKTDKSSLNPSSQRGSLGGSSLKRGPSLTEHFAFNNPNIGATVSVRDDQAGGHAQSSLTSTYAKNSTNPKVVPDGKIIVAGGDSSPAMKTEYADPSAQSLPVPTVNPSSSDTSEDLLLAVTRSEHDSEQNDSENERNQIQLNNSASEAGNDAYVGGSEVENSSKSPQREIYRRFIDKSLLDSASQTSTYDASNEDQCSRKREINSPTERVFSQEVIQVHSGDARVQASPFESTTQMAEVSNSVEAIKRVTTEEYLSTIPEIEASDSTPEGNQNNAAVPPTMSDSLSQSTQHQSHTSSGGQENDSTTRVPMYFPKTDQFPTLLSTKELIKMYTDSGSVDSSRVSSSQRSFAMSTHTAPARLAGMYASSGYGASLDTTAVQGEENSAVPETYDATSITGASLGNATRSTTDNPPILLYKEDEFSESAIERIGEDIHIMSDDEGQEIISLSTYNTKGSLRSASTAVIQEQVVETVNSESTDGNNKGKTNQQSGQETDGINVQTDKNQASNSRGKKTDASGQSTSTEDMVNDSTIKNLASVDDTSRQTRDFVSQIINDEDIRRFATDSSGEFGDDGSQVQEALSLCYSPNEDEDNDNESYVSTMEEESHADHVRPQNSYYTQNAFEEDLTLQSRQTTEGYESTSQSLETRDNEYNLAQPSPVVKPAVQPIVLHGGLFDMERTSPQRKPEPIIQLHSEDDASSEYKGDASTSHGVVQILSEDTASLSRYQGGSSHGTSMNAVHHAHRTSNKNIPKSVIVDSSFRSQPVAHNNNFVQQQHVIDSNDNGVAQRARVVHTSGDGPRPLIDSDDDRSVPKARDWPDNTTSGPNRLRQPTSASQWTEQRQNLYSDDERNSDEYQSSQDTRTSDSDRTNSESEGTRIPDSDEDRVVPNPRDWSDRPEHNNLRRSSEPLFVSKWSQHRQAMYSNENAEEDDSDRTNSESEETESSGVVISSDSDATSSDDETKVISELIAQFDDVALTNENGRLQVAVLSDTASIQSNSEFLRALEDIRRQRSMSSPNQSPRKRGHAYSDYEGNKSPRHSRYTMRGRNGYSDTERYSASPTALNPIRVEDYVPEKYTRRQNYETNNEDGTTSLRSQPQYQQRLHPGIRSYSYGGEQQRMQAGDRAHSFGGEQRPSSGPLPMYPLGPYNSGVLSGSEGVHEIDDGASSAMDSSVTSHASQRARELRAQLDEALKTSAAIRSTQERLGAELSTFKKRLDLQRQANAASPQPQRQSSEEGSPANNNMGGRSFSFGGGSPSSYRGRLQMSEYYMADGSRSFSEAPRRRVASESPTRMRNYSAATAHYVAQSDQRSASTGRPQRPSLLQYFSNTGAAAAAPSNNMTSRASNYTATETAYYSSSMGIQTGTQTTTNSEDYYSNSSSSGPDVVAMNIRQQELEEQKRKQQLENYARNTYNRLEDENMIDLTRSDTRSRGPPPRRTFF